MGQLLGTGRAAAALRRVTRPRASTGRARGARRLGPVLAAALYLGAGAAAASTPATFELRPEGLPAFTVELAARDPFAAEARCRSFLTALYHRLRSQGANPAWDPGAGQAETFDWVMRAYFTLPPASRAVRAATVVAGDQTRAYLDAFGPAAFASALPEDPLYLNDKAVCEGVLGLDAD